MTKISCLIRRLLIPALVLGAPSLQAQEDDKEVRARATWRPQAPELRELPPGVERERQEFKVERPKARLPGFERPEASLPEPEDPGESGTLSDGEDPAGDPQPQEESALRESRVESPARPRAVDATGAGGDRSPPAPRPASVVQPEYPRDALRREVEGYVTLEFTVTPEGRVTEVAITEAQPPGTFEDAVREAIARWRFEPATAGGDPVPQRVRHRFDFTIEGG